MEQFLFYWHGTMLSGKADAKEEDGGTLTLWRLPSRAAAAAEAGHLPASRDQGSVCLVSQLIFSPCPVEGSSWVGIWPS